MSNRSKFLLILQFISLAYFALFHKILSSGLLFFVQLSGLILCIWSILSMRIGNFNVQPEVKSGAELISSGPYRLIRNPMYTGILLIIIPGAVTNPSWTSLLFSLLLIVVFVLKIQDEESFLKKRFGLKYEKYMEKTFRFFPFIW